METNDAKEQSILELKLDGRMRRFVFNHPPGTFALTPASHTHIHAIIHHGNLLHGVGLDWGSGVGCLAIVAASLSKVDKVYGLELSGHNVAISRENALANQVAEKSVFYHSDSYRPYLEEDRCALASIRKNTDFILSNPPSSEGDDGFGFRREVLRGGKEFLKQNGKVFLSVSFQYNPLRVENLARESGGYLYRGLLYSTDWVPFDLGREDLLKCLKRYCEAETRGDIEYTFKSSNPGVESYIDARTAFRDFEKTGRSPLTRWQTHLFELKNRNL